MSDILNDLLKKRTDLKDILDPSPCCLTCENCQELGDENLTMMKGAFWICQKHLFLWHETQDENDDYEIKNCICDDYDGEWVKKPDTKE